MQDYDDMTMAIALIGNEVDPVTMLCLRYGRKPDLKTAPELRHVLPTSISCRTTYRECPQEHHFSVLTLKNDNVSGFDNECRGAVILQE